MTKKYKNLTYYETIEFEPTSINKEVMMEQAGGLKQPLLGIVATILSILASLSIILWFEPEVFGSWVTFLIICCIPAEVVLSLVWQNNYPAPAATLAQPLKGLYLTALAIIAGMVVSVWALKLVPGFNLPAPGPVRLHFIIMTVATILWLVIVWQCWPVAAIKQHPAFIGIGLLILTYLVTWILFRVFWNFGLMAQAPFYVAAADPGGLFRFDQAMAFYITTVGVMLAMVLLDMWPFSLIPPKVPAMGKPYVWGIVMSAWVLLVSYVIYHLFVNVGGMDPTVYLVKVPVSWIFGEFIMLNLMQTAPFQTNRQPGKGILLIVCTVILAVVTFYIYAALCKFVTGGAPSGPPTYAFELWIASAMLAVTFPMIVVFTGFMNYWPLMEGMPSPATEQGPAPAEAKPKAPPATLDEAVDTYM